MSGLRGRLGAQELVGDPDPDVERVAAGRLGLQGQAPLGVGEAADRAGKPREVGLDDLDGGHGGGLYPGAR